MLHMFVLTPLIGTLQAHTSHRSPIERVNHKPFINLAHPHKTHSGITRGQRAAHFIAYLAKEGGAPEDIHIDPHSAIVNTTGHQTIMTAQARDMDQNTLAQYVKAGWDQHRDHDWSLKTTLKDVGEKIQKGWYNFWHGHGHRHTLNDHAHAHSKAHYGPVNYKHTNAETHRLNTPQQHRQ